MSSIQVINKYWIKSDNKRNFVYGKHLRVLTCCINRRGKENKLTKLKEKDDKMILL